MEPAFKATVANDAAVSGRSDGHFDWFSPPIKAPRSIEGPIEDSMESTELENSSTSVPY